MSIITTAEFVDFKKEVLSKKIGRKQVQISDIKLLSENTLEVNGVLLGLTRDGFRNIMKLMGISNTMRNDLISKYGANHAEKLLGILTKALSSSKGSITLLIDMQKRTVINAVNSFEQMISNDIYLNTVENIISDSNLEIKSLRVLNNGGFNISTIGDKSAWGLKGIESTESFSFGLNFSNDPIKGTHLMPYNQRLICENGMSTQNFTGVHHLTNDERSWDTFYKNISELKANNFRPIGFAETLKGVMTSEASIYEVQQVRNLIKSNCKISDNELEKYAPIEEAERAYSKQGLFIDTFTDKQKQNAHSNVSYWDIINGLTDFASHNYGFDVENPVAMQTYAGKMFCSVPNLSNLIKNPFLN